MDLLVITTMEKVMDGVYLYHSPGLNFKFSFNGQYRYSKVDRNYQ
jgi:hypothetical protein